MIRNFMWRGNNDNKGLHLVEWETLIQSFENGGLNLYNLKDRNIALLAKWIRRYQKENMALWRKIIDAKYGSTSSNREPDICTLGTNKGPWKAIMKHALLLETKYGMNWVMCQ